MKHYQPSVKSEEGEMPRNPAIPFPSDYDVNRMFDIAKKDDPRARIKKVSSDSIEFEYPDRDEEPNRDKQIYNF